MYLPEDSELMLIMIHCAFQMDLGGSVTCPPINSPHNPANQFTCQFCGQGFRRKYHCKIHMLRRHGGSRIYRCRDCSKSYALREDLIAHCKRLYHTALPENLNEDPVLPTAP